MRSANRLLEASCAAARPAPATTTRSAALSAGTYGFALADVMMFIPHFNEWCPISVMALTCFEVDNKGLVIAVVESTDLVVPSGATDPCTGNKTKFEYDTYGNQTAVINPRFSAAGTPKTIFVPDLGGRMLTVTNELSHTTTFTYDAQNNVLTVADNLGNTTSNTYDAKGNLLTVTDANRQPVAAPETGAQCGAAGTGDGVDDDGDTVIDDGCPSAIYSYDNADRLIEVVDALGQSTSYGYDANGNRTSVTNARGKVTTYAFDALNRLESVTDPLSRVTSYGYDAASNLSQRTDARDLDTDYTYDAVGRLTLLEHYDGETLVDDVDYTYDEVGNRTQMVDPTGTTTFVYDDLGRLTRTTFPGPKTVSYQYDSVGNRSRIDHTIGKFATYTYDVDHSLKTVTDWLTKQTVYTYDNAGNLTDTDLPNGVDTDYTYDDAGRLESVVNVGPGPTTISSFDYTLDAAGNRTGMVAPDGTHTYDYDDLYRLTEVTYPDPETDAYTYDAVGNRLSLDSTSYTYDDADQMLTAGGVTYGYDNNGNQTSRGSDTFTYDHKNRLTQSVIGGVTSSSVYNGDGLRMSHTVSAQTTDYIWDVSAGLPVVLQDGTNTYVYGLDLISATDGAGDQTYFTYDGLGSTADLTDDVGDEIDDYAYDVFGVIRSQSGSSENFWLFTGEQQDSDEGLYYLRARYYDPETGRFLSQDPIPGGNLYAYVGNNPVNLVDPSGNAGIVPGGNPFGGCAIGNFNPFCNSGGGAGAGAGGIAIIAGTIWVITASGEAVAVGVSDVWGGLTSVFSSGKSESRRIDSITTYSKAIHYDLCRLPGLGDKSSVQSDIRKRIKNIQTEFKHLGPTKMREAVSIFKEQVWNNPCDPNPNVPVFPPIFGDGSGGGKE